MRIDWEIFDYTRNTNTGITGVSRKEKTEKEVSENYFDKIMAKSLLKLEWKTRFRCQKIKGSPKNDSNKTHTKIHQLTQQY